MKRFLKTRTLQALAIAGCYALAGPALSNPETGAATFTAGDRSYTGQYTTADRALSVNIDGMHYKGHYAARSEEVNAPLAGEPKAGKWGRAFLFATSAKVLQCQMNSGFPQVSGVCQDADGRKYELGPAIKR